MMNKLLIVTLLLLSGCYKVPSQIQPQLNHTISDSELKRRPSAFPPLSESELEKDWGKEFLIAQSFAKEMDFYRAISTYKRAEILLGKKNDERKNQITYNIIFCYYLAKKYSDVISTFEASDLLHIDSSFYAFDDLLTLLYECYLKEKEPQKANRILKLIDKSDPKRAQKLSLQTAILNAQISKLQKQTFSPQVRQAIDCYCLNVKSPTTAKYLNAFIPGAGYLYLGQRKSAMTAFLLNGLFIAATVRFFQKGYIAAGLVTLSFETGWYFGGIYGVQEETKLYNERLYERLFGPILTNEKLYPIFTLKHTF